ncbi:MAG: glycosyltransferase family 2 protein [Chitinophagaceae bacterium]|nr:MAG: glycosyltransferase family 2 protein [Chitinophagaceae bacterium]
MAAAAAAAYLLFLLLSPTIVIQPASNAPAATVSVVLCTYNGAAFLRAQLDSIRQQTYPLYEVLAFDDGSTDDTLVLLDEYAAQWPVLKVHRNPVNLGFNRNFEQALRAATGDVLAISDQDDIWMPEKVAKMMAVWKPECPVIYCDSMRFKGEPPAVPAKSHINVFFEGNDARRLLFANTVSGHAMMLRRPFLDKVLPFPEGIFYDWWTAFVAADNGGVCLLDEPLVLHRIHGANASGHEESSRTDVILYLHKDVIRHMKVFKDAPQVSEQVRAFARMFYEAYQHREEKGGRWRLFRLILQHLETYFYYRRRKGAHKLRLVKYAYYYAFTD